MLLEHKTQVVQSKIPSGQTTGSAIKIAGFGSGVLFPPAAFTGATISWDVSADGANWAPFDLAALAITAGQAEPLDASLFGAPFIRPISASAEAADRVLTVALSTAKAAPAGGIPDPVLLPAPAGYSGVTGATSVDASAGNLFLLELTGNITLTVANPPAAGSSEKLEIWLKQDGAGNHTLTLGAAFNLPSSGPSPLVLSTAAGAVDKFFCEWNPVTSQWDVLSFITGY